MCVYICMFVIEYACTVYMYVCLYVYACTVPVGVNLYVHVILCVSSRVRAPVRVPSLLETSQRRRENGIQIDTISRPAMYTLNVCDEVRVARKHFVLRRGRG